jgi:hypothetical protein
MLDLTAAAEVDGQRFDGVDIFLSLPHTDVIHPTMILKAGRSSCLTQSGYRLAGRAGLGTDRRRFGDGV